MVRLTADRLTVRMGIARTVSLLAATLTMGLAAGLFYTYFFSVMPGLAAADDRTLVTAIQRINVRMLNGWFALAFVGAPVFTALAAALHLGADERPALPWIVAGLVLYGITLVITFARNIPLNNELAAAGDPDLVADLAALRTRFETAWVRWNVLRAATSVAAFASLLWAVHQAAR
jgi:uncharacterized membrane protein